MSRIRVFIVLVLAITAGGGLALGTYNFMQRAPVQAAALPTKPVVVAAVDLNLGAELRREDLRVVDWPANALPGGTIANPDEVVGRGLIQPVVQNEPIWSGALASKEEGAGLPPVIPKGLRAVSVRVNEVIGVAGYVLPGTRVDVVATVNPSNQQTDITSKVILTNVQVLAAGTKIDRETDKNKPVPVTVVTLLVNPDEAERLTLASGEGKIQLALRNPLDTTTPETRGIRPAALLGAVPVARVARAKTSDAAKPVAGTVPSLPDVEIIRGDKRTREVATPQEH
jgi:pilus assembly protein CpaB